MEDAVRRYIDAIPTDKKPLFDRLHSLILDLYPAADIVLSYQIPTYKVEGSATSGGASKPPQPPPG